MECTATTLSMWLVHLPMILNKTDVDLMISAH